MDDQGQQRREALPEHETRPEGREGSSATRQYAELSDPEATAIDKAAVNPDDVSIEPGDSDGNNQTPPITRSG